MAFNFNFPLRLVQALFAIIILGLTGYVAHWYDTRTTYLSPSQVNFLIFTAFYSLLAITYLLVSVPYFPKLTHKYATLAVDGLTCLFWFAGFLALAVFLKGLVLCEGGVCGAARAAAVFAAFEW
ncbi:hypothetical protein MMC19_004589 [Ptychographa xylographoides]|nr:hypothetical protein [Ptychographa xylographoides]